MNKLSGIDISEFNGDINFKKLKKEIDFVYIRATFGRFGIDKRFKEYVNGCIENEIPFGLYYYSYAVDIKQAEEEVNFFLKMIQNYKEQITFPLAIDMEDSDGYKYNHGNPNKDILTNICVVACEEITKNGYTPIIYASADWFKNKLDEEKLNPYMKWLAWWNVSEDKVDSKKYQIHQYSSKGSLEAVSSKYVDLNYSYFDFITLKEYVKNVSKINFIKAKTTLNDLDIQYLSCYKFGQDLVNKIYDGLKNKAKIEKSNNPNYEKEIKKFFNLEDKTIKYLNFYIYSLTMLQKLYNSITKENNIINIKD